MTMDIFMSRMVIKTFFWNNFVNGILKRCNLTDLIKFQGKLRMNFPSGSTFVDFWIVFETREVFFLWKLLLWRNSKRGILFIWYISCIMTICISNECVFLGNFLYHIVTSILRIVSIWTLTKMISRSAFDKFLGADDGSMQ
jgi:hypothetical protein